MDNNIREMLAQRLDSLDKEKQEIVENTKKVYYRIWEFIINNLAIEGIHFTLEGDPDSRGDHVCDFIVRLYADLKQIKVEEKMNFILFRQLFEESGIRFKETSSDNGKLLNLEVDMSLEDFKDILQERKQAEESEKPKSYF